MLACLDVDYRSTCVVAACLTFREWTDAAPDDVQVRLTPGAAAAYEPGQFYRRELPHLLDVLRRLPRLPDTLVVDGYVWLGTDAPGLGAHLHEALARRAAVVGVAKRPYRGASIGAPVRRGQSATPLWVTAVGMDVDEAVAHVHRMHGPHRVPTLLKQVDRVVRDHPA